MIHIGVIGEHDPANETHVATDDALGHSALACGVGVEATWVSTADVAGADDVERFDGLLVAPGSPYRSLDGALRAIEHARLHEVPLLGTCGGLQHIVLELARNVAGVEDAQHAEYDPSASTLFVTPLSCSLAGQTMDVTVRPGTRAAAAYGSATATERYYCDFGLAPDRLDDLLATGAVVSGTDEQGEVRIVELPSHPFFVGTLFVPQASSTLVRPHPIVTAFVAAAASAATGAGAGDDAESGVTIIGE
jgi:CTP synthase (UTP-ammonia lyase)